MPIDNAFTEQLKKLSIRSRLAYGAVCLEGCLAGLPEHPAIQNLVNKIWEFTESGNLGEWMDEMLERQPDEILNTNTESELPDFETLSVEDVSNLKEAYGMQPKFILAIIDEITEIGISNLFGGIVGHSQQTLAPLVSVIKIMQEQGQTLPDIAPFMKSTFEEHHGWGYAHEREFYLE